MSLTGNAESGNKPRYTLRGKLSGLEKIQGKSAYEIAVINGFKGTEAEWLLSLKGTGAAHKWDGTKLTITSATGTSSADLKGRDGKDGKDGVGVKSFERTAGDGSPGTADTYTLTMTDGNTNEISVYNGADAPAQSYYRVEFGTLAYSSNETEELSFLFSQCYREKPVFIPHTDIATLTLKIEPLQSAEGYYGGKVTVTNTNGYNTSTMISVAAFCALPTGEEREGE